MVQNITMIWKGKKMKKKINKIKKKHNMLQIQINRINEYKLI